MGIDNAVYAASQMIIQAANHLPLAEVLNMILTALPLKSDFDEADLIYGCVCDLMNTGNPATTGLLPQIFTVLAKSLSLKKLEDVVKKNIAFRSCRYPSTSTGHTYCRRMI